MRAQDPKTAIDSFKPTGVKVLYIVLLVFSIMAFFGSLLLWGQGFLFAPPPGLDLSLPITDLFVNAPASLIAAIGLWRMKPFGYIATQFVAGFYVYASVEIFVDLWQHGAAMTAEFCIDRRYLPDRLSVAASRSFLQIKHSPAGVPSSCI
jgi:hypothetical protein